MSEIVTIRAYPTRGADTVTVDYNRPPEPPITVTVTQEQSVSLYKRLLASKNYHAYPSMSAGLWNAGRNRENE